MSSLSKESFIGPREAPLTYHWPKGERKLTDVQKGHTQRILDAIRNSTSPERARDLLELYASSYVTRAEIEALQSESIPIKLVEAIQDDAQKILTHVLDFGRPGNAVTVTATHTHSLARTFIRERTPDQASLATADHLRKIITVSKLEMPKNIPPKGVFVFPRLGSNKP